MKSKLALICICIVAFSSCMEQETEVVICSSIHGLHESNKNYSYEDLFNYVNNLNPDIIGVEIRQEDVDSSTTYLKTYYPFEMYQILKLDSSRIAFGIDWLGTDIEGMPIPKNYFKELDVIQLSNKAKTDSIFQKSLIGLNELAELKNVVASSSSIIELNDGRYDSLNSLYYHMLDSLYVGAPYSRIAAFYKKRDVKITERILEIIDKNRGKRMMFILGADHRSRAVESFKEKFKDDPCIILLKIK